MEDYKNYLAANILSEGRVISYRLLSRALKVNVNTAKEMLYEFHQQQNAKKPGTIHATYLVSGTKPKNNVATGQKDGEDEYMQSSPFMSSSMPRPSEETGETSVLSISLVKEEDLDSLKSQYGHISSIHVYSIGPHSLKDLQLLSDCTREVQTLIATEDPLEYYPKYGTIINPQVRRRPKHRPLPPVSAPVKPLPGAKSKATESTTDATKSSSTNSIKQEVKQQSAVAKDFFGKGKDKAKPAGSSEPSSKESIPVPNPSTLKRESSSIFKAFAKAKPILKREGTESSAGAEDGVMTDAVHFDEDDEETYVPPVQKEESTGDRKARKEREAKLRAMMEEDEDEDDEARPAPEPEPEPEEEEEEMILEHEKPKEEPEPMATVSGGRRRGKRRVMRKRTVKDDKGYLVTSEEPVWESFSEDEPAPPPVKVRPSLSSTSGPKGKKVPDKKGQGSIMSFFGKK